MNQKTQLKTEERTFLAGTNKFEMLLFRLGESGTTGRSEIFGINVFKIREIVATPPITKMVGAPDHILGIVNIRGQMIPVIDLPAVVGFTPKTGLNIMLITEFARTTQAFAVEMVDEIVRLDWQQIMSADNSMSHGMVTSIAKLDDNQDNSRLAQILDVESILQSLIPNDGLKVDPEKLGHPIQIPAGSVVVAADDSVVARSMIEQELTALNLPFVIHKTGLEAWKNLEEIAAMCAKENIPMRNKVAVVLTDLEMPEMDGFTLTRSIKSQPIMSSVPVIVHSSLTGETNEHHVRESGANAYVAKFAAKELAEVLRKVLGQ